MLSVTVNQPISLALKSYQNKKTDIVKGKHLVFTIFFLTLTQEERVNLGTDGPSNLQILTSFRPPTSTPSDVGASLGRLMPN